MVQAKALDMGRGASGNCAEFLYAGLPRRFGRRSKRSRRASVTTRVMVSPVSWAMAVARRWASRSLMLRAFIRRLSVKLMRFYHFFRLASGAWRAWRLATLFRSMLHRLHGVT